MQGRTMRRQHGFRTKGLMGLALLLILIGLTSRGPWPHVRLMLPPLASGATATQQTVPQPGIDGIPASVEQLTVAFDGWGGDVVPDDAARFALLRGRQVDMAVNIPYAIAKDLPRSESTRRGVNPNKGSIWTQTHLANGKMQITFDAEFIIKEKSPGWEALQGDPTLNPKVREGLELAIDKRAIVENFHYGFTSLNQSIYSMGSFGWRKEQGEKISPYDPKRAKALLTEAARLRLMAEIEDEVLRHH
jgi:ABC-type transport system substrate-binding protein